MKRERESGNTLNGISPGLVVIEADWRSRGCEFESWHRLLGKWINWFSIQSTYLQINSLSWHLGKFCWSNSLPIEKSELKLFFNQAAVTQLLPTVSMQMCNKIFYYYCCHTLYCVIVSLLILKDWKFTWKKYASRFDAMCKVDREVGSKFRWHRFESNH